MAKKSRPKTTKQTIVKHHSDWMRLVERSGPFLSIPVLLNVLPQGLSKDDSQRRGDLRQLYESWQADRDDVAVHRGWIKSVLTECLEIPDEYFFDAGRIPTTLQHRVPEHHEKLMSDMAVIETGDGDSDQPRLLVMIVPADQALDKAIPGKQWKATPQTRMSDLVRGCSATGVSLGLVTNGEQWTLVSSKPGETASFTTWYASIWFDEPITLRAFCELLSAQRFFGDPELTLEKLLERSAQHQHEVTDQLGLQVRDALETLVEAIDQIDRDQNRKLLKGFSETQLYEACVTVMMRLVFLFFAEEQRLLPVKEAFYEQNYSLLNLLEQLQEKSHAGEELLEWGGAAWSRLLAMFRAIHSGVRHDDMQLHAYGSSLFDPDRFPFLEGRARGTTWKEVEASPLPINDRTILHILEALKLLEVRGISKGERITRRMSFRELDVEDIGHIYENLLDHTTKRANGHVLGLAGTKGKEPEVELAAIEQSANQGREKLVEFLNEQTGKSASAINKALCKSSTLSDSVLLTACSNDTQFFERVKPYANLLRLNRSQQPIIISDGGVYVTEGSDRRSTGTHYTPRSLTEPIVRYTLEPLIYEGPSEGKSEEEWKLKSPTHILDLKICDMACGSGAFLVQACRYMGERLVESWELVAANLGGKTIVSNSGVSEKTASLVEVPRITPNGEPSKGEPNEQLIPIDTDERRVYAQRLIADRCIYGVDKNPLAVEMAKLSLWLLTLAKDKPFTFLNHSLRSGDSLVGISSIQNLTNFSISGNRPIRPLLEQQREQIEKRVNAVRLVRKQLENLPCNTSTDIERKELMLRNIDEQSRRLAFAADMLLAVSWASLDGSSGQEGAINSTLAEVEHLFKEAKLEDLETLSRKRLANAGLLDNRQKVQECRFHWAIEFPEVFIDAKGFDGMIGNPPFINAIEGSVDNATKAWLTSTHKGLRGTADYSSYFLSKAHQLVQPNGSIGLILPQGFLSTTSARKLRESLLVRRPPSLIYAPSAGSLFTAANVRVVALVLSRTQVCLAGNELPLHEVRDLSANWWEAVSSGDDCDGETVSGTPLSKLVDLGASMTTGIAYDIKPYIENRDDVDWPRLVTTGLIDPGICFWGERQCRYLKDDYLHPVIQPVTSFAKGIKKRLANSKRPKVLVAGVAGPGNRIEAFVDEEGVYCGAVSTYTIYDPENCVEKLRAISEYLNSKAVQNLVESKLAAASMGSGLLTIRKDFLADLVIPDELLEVLSTS